MRAWNIAKQKGLSLVETMIALTLGAIVTAGVVQLFVANSETYNLLQGQSRLQESGRFALEFLTRSMQLAGYKGCFSRNDDVYTTIDPAGNIPYEFDLRIPLVGYEGGPGGWTPALDELPDTNADDSFISGNGVPIDDVIPGTDVVVVRRSSSMEYPLSAPLPTSAEDVVVSSGAPITEFALDDLALIHDCEKSTIFRVTGLTFNAGPAETTIGHDTDDIDPTANDFTKLAEENTYDEDAYVSAIETTIFYIAPGAGENNQGDQPFSLWRKTGTAAPVELIEGVEDLQLLYGEDTDNDGVPNVYNTADVVSDYADVITVRISIVVNSVDDVSATSAPTHGCVAGGGEQPCLDGVDYDGLIRRTFHQTVQLRNQG